MEQQPELLQDQWLMCNSSGAACTAIAGATGSTYTIASSAVGKTIRVQEIAADASGSSSPAVSTQTATVISNTPAITGFTPTSGITGSSVTITGTAFTGATAVKFDGLAATFKVSSSTQIEATVPNGARAGTIAVTTPVKTGTSKTSFTPTLSIASFSPAKAAPGATVTITGVGFDSGSTVSFGSIKASSVTHASATKLQAVVPAEASTAAIKVTNSSAPVGAVASATSLTVS
jgi:hypothetical protein